MTVLILAAELDITADHMVAVLNERGVPVLRMDTAWFPQRAAVDATFCGGRWLGVRSRRSGGCGARPLGVNRGCAPRAPSAR